VLLPGVLAVGLVGVGGCGGGGGSGAADTSPTSRPATIATTVVPANPPSTVPPEFAATIAPIDPATQARMTGVSWRPGCPVPLAGLRLLHVTYWGFDGAAHTGELVVHAAWAERLVGVLRTLYEARFPIERMQLVDDYGGSDEASVLANNTSAFNCRAVTGGTGWSRHAYGLAIDIDPRQNPYVYPDGHLLDPRSEPYRDRARQEAGMVHEGDVVHGAFAAIGWRWGGSFGDTPDPQHFDTAPPG